MKLKTLTSLVLAGTILVAGCNIPGNPIPPKPNTETNTTEETTIYEEPITEEPIIYEEPEEDEEEIIEEEIIVEPDEPIVDPIEPEPEPEPEIEQRSEILTNIYFQNYSVGDIFKFTGKIQSALISPIYLDNSIGALEWRLMKGDEVIDVTKIEQDFFAKFKEYGWMEFALGLAEAKATFSNVELDYNLKHYNIDYPLSTTVKFPMPNFTFQESGIHRLDAFVKYEFDGTEYQSKFMSEDFEVGA